MHALLKQGMDSGEVAPLPWTVYGRDQCQDAFRFLASGARLAPLCLHATHASRSTALLAIRTTATPLQCSPDASIMPMHGAPTPPHQQALPGSSRRTVQLVAHLGSGPYPSSDLTLERAQARTWARCWCSAARPRRRAPGCRQRRGRMRRR